MLFPVIVKKIGMMITRGTLILPVKKPKAKEIKTRSTMGCRDKLAIDWLVWDALKTFRYANINIMKRK